MRQNFFSALQKPWSRILAQCRGLRGDSGSALWELALIISFLGVPLLLGTADIATLCYDAIEVQNAANAGAMFAMYSTGDASSTTGIMHNAQNEAPDFGTNLTVTSSESWLCILNMSAVPYTTQAAATAACTGAGNAPATLVTVQTSATVTLPFPVPGLASSYPLVGNSVQMVQP
jgi:Flp pilus assembly protein TadG